MRTMIIIVGGIVLLGLFVFAARWISGASTNSTVAAARIFIPVWLVTASINLWMGNRAGYSVAEELPIF